MSWDTFAPLVEALGTTGFAQWLGQSTVRIAWLLTFHLFGLTLLLGSVALSSLYLLGVIRSRYPAAVAARSVTPVTAVGLIVMVLTGALIFTGGAVEYYAGEWFRLKMQLLVVAVAFQFTVVRFVTRARDGEVASHVRLLTGAAALMLWFAVGWSGRAIAFF